MSLNVYDRFKSCVGGRANAIFVVSAVYFLILKKSYKGLHTISSYIKYKIITMAIIIVM